MKKQLPLILGAVLIGVIIGIVVTSLVTNDSVTEDKVSQPYSVEYEGNFSDQEKILARNLVLDPWLVFENGNDREYDRVVVSKVGTDFPVFSINAYKNGEVATSFGISSIKGQYDYERWAPTCFSQDCEGEIPEEFSEKYPELVIRAKAAGRRTMQ